MLMVSIAPTDLHSVNKASLVKDQRGFFFIISIQTILRRLMVTFTTLCDSEPSLLNTPPFSMETFIASLWGAILLYDVLNVINTAYHSPPAAIALPNTGIVLV